MTSSSAAMAPVFRTQTSRNRARMVLGRFDGGHPGGEKAERQLRQGAAERAVMAMVADGRPRHEVTNEEISVVEALMAGVGAAVGSAWIRERRGPDRAGMVAAMVMKRMVAQHPAGSVLGAASAAKAADHAVTVVLEGRKRTREKVKEEAERKARMKAAIGEAEWARAAAAGEMFRWDEAEANAADDVELVFHAGRIVELMIIKVMKMKRKLAADGEVVEVMVVDDEVMAVDNADAVVTVDEAADGGGDGGGR